MRSDAKLTPCQRHFLVRIARQLAFKQRARTVSHNVLRRFWLHNVNEWPLRPAVFLECAILSALVSLPLTEGWIR